MFTRATGFRYIVLASVSHSSRFLFCWMTFTECVFQLLLSKKISSESNQLLGRTLRFVKQSTINPFSTQGQNLLYKRWNTSPLVFRHSCSSSLPFLFVFKFSVKVLTSTAEFHINAYKVIMKSWWGQPKLYSFLIKLFIYKGTCLYFQNIGNMLKLVINDFTRRPNLFESPQYHV